MKILITSGGTRVYIDNVRYIGNISTGRTGKDLAEVAMLRGHEVTFFTSINGKKPNKDFYLGSDLSLKKIEFDTFEDYKYLLLQELNKTHYDVIISCAAVSDYTVEPFNGKINSDSDFSLKLIKTEKVLSLIKEQSPDSIVVGYKLLSGCTTLELLNACEKQVKESKVDLVIGNDIKALREQKYYQIFYKPDGEYDFVFENYADRLIQLLENNLRL